MSCLQRLWPSPEKYEIKSYYFHYEIQNKPSPKYQHSTLNRMPWTFCQSTFSRHCEWIKKYNLNLSSFDFRNESHIVSRLQRPLPFNVNKESWNFFNLSRCPTLTSVVPCVMSIWYNSSSCLEVSALVASSRTVGTKRKICVNILCNSQGNILYTDV